MIAWLLVGVIMASTITGDLLQTAEMKRHGEVRFTNGRLRRSLGIFTRPLLLLTILCMAVSFFAFLKLLTVADLSFAVPATAGTFVLETILAKIFLKEQINTLRWAGACLVACGVALLAL
ncbi:MAG TPA: EamA family transporter [Bryobacteraceae bacterium]|jgi:drug/metabolite transporter (DMT)-like permease|nr:EamA family transporter [Bryobacteraceae bacterium]